MKKKFEIQEHREDKGNGETYVRVFVARDGEEFHHVGETVGGSEMVDLLHMHARQWLDGNYPGWAGAE